MLVVFYHIDRYYFTSGQYWSEAFLNCLFSFGHAGVEFFFVLSGLIITRMHADDIGVRGRLLPFVKKRFARIYPFYWVCLAIIVAALYAIPGYGGGSGDLRTILGSAILIGPEAHEATLFVAWTLFHEMLFYAVFGLAIWRPRLGVPAILLWFAACASLGVTDLSVAYPLRFINLLFGFGIVAGLALRRARVPAPGALAAAGIALYFGTGLDEVYWGETDRLLQIIGYGLGAALILVGLVELERRRRVAPPAGLVLVGQASYAIYLTHMLVLPVAAKAAAAAGLTRTLPAPLAFVALSALAALVGVAVHLVVERRLVRLARDLLDVRRPIGAQGA